MVQLLNSSEMQRGEMAQVNRKVKIEDNFEGEDGPLLNKRSKHSPPFQVRGIGLDGHLLPPSEYNPLDEPSPLGLRLRKSPSLLELIQMRLSQGNSPNGGNQLKKENKGGASASGSTDKQKASNFPATVLRIGSWEYTSRYEGDLVAKCYFAKHKLVWEVLDCGLKNKIEIQWADISALRAKYPDDVPGTLDVVLARQPLFFRETNPQPRKHTLWQATSDFTNGQASLHRHHFLQCPEGLLGKHFEKLIQYDPRLNFLSHQQEDINLDSPFFESQLPVCNDLTDNKARFDKNEGNSDVPLSSSGGQCSSSMNETDSIVWTRESVRNETPSPSSVMDTRAINEMKSYLGGEPWREEHSNWDQIKVPGLHTSMSMSDLVSHLENRVSEQKSSSHNILLLSIEERRGLEILDEISKCLLSDSQFVPESDEKSLMLRVDSLCCLLQKDALPQPLSCKNDKKVVLESPVPAGFVTGSSKMVEDKDVCDSIPPSMSRKDSVGELLMNLPRIASLPKFFFNIGEDGHNQAHC